MRGGKAVFADKSTTFDPPTFASLIVLLLIANKSATARFGRFAAGEIKLGVRIPMLDHSFLQVSSSTYRSNAGPTGGAVRLVPMGNDLVE